MPNVLIVEDDPVLRRYLRRWLEAAGYAVAEAGDGAAAVAAAAALAGLILMDIGLADGADAGLDATRAIRARPDTARIPVVATSGHMMAFERERTLEAGCADLIGKPYTKDAILAAVRAHLPEPAR